MAGLTPSQGLGCLSVLPEQLFTVQLRFSPTAATALVMVTQQHPARSPQSCKPPHHIRSSRLQNQQDLELQETHLLSLSGRSSVTVTQFCLSSRSPINETPRQQPQSTKSELAPPSRRRLSMTRTSHPRGQEVCEDVVELVKGGRGVRSSPGMGSSWCQPLCPAPRAPAWWGGQGRNDTARPFPQDQL